MATGLVVQDGGCTLAGALSPDSGSVACAVSVPDGASAGVASDPVVAHIGGAGDATPGRRAT
ncbi:MAG: hypothetical protein U1F43_31410 [Myxococcota bacterium]